MVNRLCIKKKVNDTNEHKLNVGKKNLGNRCRQAGFSCVFDRRHTHSLVEV